jgi:hypothetical protein
LADDPLPLLISQAVLALTLLVLIVGELVALNALAKDHPERVDPATVYTAVMAGLVIVAFLTFFGER